MGGKQRRKAGAGGGCPKDLVDCSQGLDLYPVDKETLLRDLKQASEQLGVNLRTLMLTALCRTA